jgi:NitT/TauT family transport system ATP-binding protein
MRIFGRRPEGLNRLAGCLFQRDAVMPKTARDNVAIALKDRVTWRGARPGESAGVAAARRQGGVADRFPHQISGGQRKPVGLAHQTIWSRLRAEVLKAYGREAA